MDSIKISLITDPRLVPYRHLKDRQLAQEHGLFLVEGEHLVRRLLSAELATHSILMTASRYESRTWDIPENVPIYLATKKIISQIVGFDFHRGVLALGYRPESKQILQQDDLNRLTRLIVCPEINNVENLGIIMRTAAGLGYEHLLLGESCCDPFSRRAIRTSMGAAFLLNTCRSSNLLKDMNTLKSKYGFEWHAAVLDESAEPLSSIQPPAKVGILFGAEADGLDSKWIRNADRLVSIPMTAGIDSLNVGVAAGIFMYYYRRRFANE